MVLGLKCHSTREKTIPKQIIIFVSNTNLYIFFNSLLSLLSVCSRRGHCVPEHEAIYRFEFIYLFFLGALFDHRNWIWCSMHLVCISISAWCMSCDSFTFYLFFTLSLSRMRCCLLLFMLYRKYIGFGCGCAEQCKRSAQATHTKRIRYLFSYYAQVYVLCKHNRRCCEYGICVFFYIPLISLFTTHLFSFMLLSVLTLSQSDSFIHVWRHFLIRTRFILRSYFCFSTRLTVLSSACAFLLSTTHCIDKFVSSHFTLSIAYAMQRRQQQSLGSSINFVKFVWMTESSRKLVAITSFRCVDNRVDFRLVLWNELTNSKRRRGIEAATSSTISITGSTGETKNCMCTAHTHTIRTKWIG